MYVRHKIYKGRMRNLVAEASHWPSKYDSDEVWLMTTTTVIGDGDFGGKDDCSK